MYTACARSSGSQLSSLHYQSAISEHDVSDKKELPSPLRTGAQAGSDSPNPSGEAKRHKITKDASPAASPSIAATQSHQQVKAIASPVLRPGASIAPSSPTNHEPVPPAATSLGLTSGMTIEEIRQKAEQDDPEAQNLLGMHYLYSNGDPDHLKKAALWFQQVANNGFVRAFYNMGLCYSYDTSTPDAHKEANKWFRRAFWRGIPIDNDLLTQDYYRLTSQRPINWKLIIGAMKAKHDELRQAHPLHSLGDEYFTEWVGDNELHEIAIPSLNSYCDIFILHSLPGQILKTLTRGVRVYIQTVGEKQAFSREQTHGIEDAVNFLHKVKRACEEHIKASEDNPLTAMYWKDLSESLAKEIDSTLVALYCKTGDYLAALLHLKQTPKNYVSWAKLLYYCEDWRFPFLPPGNHLEAGHEWKECYLLIAALLSANYTLDDESCTILQNVLDSLDAGRRMIPSTRATPWASLHYAALRQRCQPHLEHKPDLPKLFFELLNRDHVWNFFRYCSMRTLLNQALQSSQEKAKPLIQQLSELLEKKLGKCKAFEPLLLSTEAIEGLRTLVDCILQIQASDQPKAAYESIKAIFDEPLVKAWIKKMPGFAANLAAYL